MKNIFPRFEILFLSKNFLLDFAHFYKNFNILAIQFILETEIDKRFYKKISENCKFFKVKIKMLYATLNVFHETNFKIVFLDQNNCIVNFIVGSSIYFRGLNSEARNFSSLHQKYFEIFKLLLRIDFSYWKFLAFPDVGRFITEYFFKYWQIIREYHYNALKYIKPTGARVVFPRNSSSPRDSIDHKFCLPLYTIKVLSAFLSMKQYPVNSCIYINRIIIANALAAEMSKSENDTHKRAKSVTGYLKAIACRQAGEFMSLPRTTNYRI